MFSSRPKGQVISSSPLVRQTNSLMESTATFDATSPAAWPPIPSATTKSFCSGFRKRESSFPFRLRPTSVTAWYTIFIGGLRTVEPKFPCHLLNPGIPGGEAEGGLRRFLGAVGQALLVEQGSQVHEEGRVGGGELGCPLHRLDGLPHGLGVPAQGPTQGVMVAGFAR